ncbi:hypothetical protein LOK49_LG02G01516 [Camellia lanceoleosa]|uniref:Uncharacterized protein n=1 Tax=Camellia lanceoleosa TaxID=1840588 RepID=A0ACC0IK39_9ERIC|nr:hypothetical protein LOK49_LG02G01516 [Camellia lanceoleosa]
MAKTDKVSVPLQPTIILPPRTSFDSIFASLSPGPMTLVSSFFSDSYSDSDSAPSSLALASHGFLCCCRWWNPNSAQLFSQ